jgi:hypothetical protein
LFGFISWIPGFLRRFPPSGEYDYKKPGKKKYYRKCKDGRNCGAGVFERIAVILCHLYVLLCD